MLSEAGEKHSGTVYKQKQFLTVFTRGTIIMDSYFG